MIDLQSFDLTNGFNVLRILCGAFFFPHIAGKFFEPAALEFFTEAGFRPPRMWMYLSASVETVLATCLILDLFTPYVAAMAAFQLTVAAVAVFRVTGGKWLWNIGGGEYPLFWAIVCIVVAMEA